jgi:hypothetical protein
MATPGEFLSSNLAIDFPFQTPSPIVTIGGDPVRLGEVIADAAVQTNRLLQQDVRIAALTLAPLPVPLSGAIVLKWRDGTILADLDSAMGDTFNVYEFGEWIVTEWAKSTIDVDGLTKLDVVVRLVLSKTVLASLPSLSVATDEDTAFLDAGIVQQGPERVRRAFLRIGNLPLIDLGSRIVFEAGFNMQFAQADVDDEGDPVVRAQQILQLAAVPGAGKGRFPDCVNDVPIRRINSVEPDPLRDFKLLGDDCYFVERPLVEDPLDITGAPFDQVGTAKEATLKVNNSCVECCACDDYVAVYENLRKLNEDAKAAAAKLVEMDAALRELIDEYLNKFGDGTTKVSVKVEGRQGLINTVSISVVNGTAETIKETISIGVEMAPSPPTMVGEYVNNSGKLSLSGGKSLSLDLEGTFPSFSVELADFELPAGATLSFSFLMKMVIPSGLADAGGMLNVQANMTAGEFGGSNSDSAEVKPPGQGTT